MGGWAGKKCVIREREEGERKRERADGKRGEDEMSALARCCCPRRRGSSVLGLLSLVRRSFEKGLLADLALLPLTQLCLDALNWL